LFLEEQKEGSTLVGHWQCMIHSVNDQGTHIINFFDSYGLSPFQWNQYISPAIQKQLHELSGTMLIPLLEKAYFNGTKIYYNNVRLQQMKNDVNTCGRYAVSRLLNTNMDNQEFINFLDTLKKQYKVKTYDEVVTIYTYNKLGK
jgi:hypothetical protein